MSDKQNLLKDVVEHIDITAFDASQQIDAMAKMSFSSRELAKAAKLFKQILEDEQVSVILTIAGSTQAAGCMQLYADLVRYNLVDAIVATGAAIVDMDFFEALGFKHYQGDATIDDKFLRKNYIDRIYDTYINEEDLQICDQVIAEIAENLPAKPYSSREFIYHMGKYLASGKAKKPNSLVELCYQHQVPIFCPAFTDSSAGFGLVLHQVKNPKQHLTLDSIRDFKELTEIKIKAGETGLLMVGGGVPKNFVQDTVICAEIIGQEVPMHKYAIQITVADVRDGACSSSTLKEAASWGKVDTIYEQMVFAEATLAMPLIGSYAYHQANWQIRQRRNFSQLFK